MKCREVINLLEQLSPEKYACDWDNVGLLVGRKEKEVKKILVTLDATNRVIQKAIAQEVDMIVTHHPMIFSSIKQVNEENFTSEKVLDLVEHGICCYAMHTNFDAIGGMADLIASEQYLNLQDVLPIEPTNEICALDGEGMGRFGKLPYAMTAYEVAEYVKERLQIPTIMLYQDASQVQKVFEKIAVLPGSGKSEMRKVWNSGYELYLTGDYGHHEGLDAIDMGLTVLDATHHGLEHIFISYIGNYLRKHIKDDAVKILEVDSGCPMKVL